jgi:hypothetical protein
MDLDYAPGVTEELAYELERAAQWMGLKLDRLELLGQDAELARAFVDRVETGDHEAFLVTVDWARLADLRADEFENPAQHTSNPRALA